MNPIRPVSKACAFAALTACAVAMPAHAVSELSLVPESTTVQVGTPFSVDVVATLDAADDLAAYFADIVYDPAALRFESMAVSDVIGVDALDLSLPPEIVGDVGLINASAESFLTDFSGQADELVLASWMFTAIALGDTTLEFGDFAALDDPSLAPLTFDTSAATVSAVPVPAAVWLMGSALAAVAGLRRRA
jgi:hypothetical protein